MTISLAWVRKVGTVEELVVASDSRLCFGCRWDCCPKILPLPRGDCVLCFAGNTMYAYPVIQQAITAIEQHPRLLSRGMNLDDLKGHLLRILNSMVSQIHDLPRGADAEPDTTFLFAGWSWKFNRFKVWLLHFDAHLKRFTFRPSRRWSQINDKVLAFTGDYKPEYMKRVVALLGKNRKLSSGSFDMEPLEVLRDMLREPSFDLIGGAPQVVKVYKYSNTKAYGVFWPNRSAETVTLFGRPLLEYEKLDCLIVDPDTMQTVEHV